MRCLEAALSQAGAHCPREREKRKLFFLMNVASCVLHAVSALLVWTDMKGRYIYFAACVMNSVASLAAIALVLCKYNVTTPVVVCLAQVYFISTIFIDVSARTQEITAWPLLVVIIDFLLVMQVPTHHSMWLVCVAVVYLVVMCNEENFRFGILDIPGLMPQEERAAFMAERVACTELPCPKKKVDFHIAAVVVFVTDFIVTRGFARGIVKEQESMERTINTVQEIASLLAGYDVEQVAELLKKHGGDLPEGMTVALRRLEENLRMYKAYLPKTCLPFACERADPNSAEGSVESVDTEVSMPSFSSSCRLQQLGLASLGLLSAKVTLLTVNVKDTLIRLVEDSACFSDLFTTLLLKTLQGTETRRGMVDVFIGDRIHCSFNASKQCASHATSALHTATLLIRGGVTSYANVGVATGKVLRGDMGCEVMRRFSMVGELVRDVNGLERAGRMLGCDVVCNRMCFSDAECEHQLRLLPCKVEVASGCEAQVVAELIAKQENTAETADEWMYMIGGKKEWEEYNNAVRGYLRGEQSDLDVAMAWSAAGGVGTPAHAVPSGTCRVVCSYLAKPSGK